LQFWARNCQLSKVNGELGFSLARSEPSPPPTIQTTHHNSGSHGTQDKSAKNWIDARVGEIRHLGVRDLIVASFFFF